MLNMLLKQILKLMDQPLDFSGLQDKLTYQQIVCGIVCYSEPPTFYGTVSKWLRKDSAKVPSTVRFSPVPPQF